MSKSQLYHYFADKDALIREIITLQTGRVLAAQEPHLHQFGSLAGLRRWRGDGRDESDKRRRPATARSDHWPVSWPDHSEHARALLTYSFQTWESYLVDGLHTMRDRGELAPNADPRDLANAVMAALQGGLLLTRLTRTTRSLELALDMALEYIAYICCESTEVTSHAELNFGHRLIALDQATSGAALVDGWSAQGLSRRG